MVVLLLLQALRLFVRCDRCCWMLLDIVGVLGVAGGVGVVAGDVGRVVPNSDDVVGVFFAGLRYDA